MRATEFIVNLFTRYAPVDAQTLSNLKIELSDYFTRQMENLKGKEQRNADLQQKAETIQKELDGMDEHTPDFEKKLFDFQKIQKQMEKPTLVEQVVSFLEKPWVRLLLLVSFVLISRWLMKKLTEPDKEEPEEVEPQQPQHQWPGYQNGSWQPYGGYNPPPPGWYHPQQGKH